MSENDLNIDLYNLSRKEYIWAQSKVRKQYRIKIYSDPCTEYNTQF